MNRTGKHALTRSQWLCLALLVLAVPATLFVCYRAGNRHYYLAGVAILVYTILPFFVRLERRTPSARELSVLAVMSAVAVVSRAAFIWAPHFKPICAIIMISGAALGAEAGFLVGALSAFASNFLFGQGIWTPWQMFAFGACGFLAGVLCYRSRWKYKRVPFALFVFAVVLCLVGPLLDTAAVFTMPGVLNASSVGAIYLSGVPVNLIHALCAGLTALLVAQPLFERLDRIRTKYGMFL